MKGRLECSSYRFANSDEYCLKVGAGCDVQILLVPPLFDEMNRMRRMILDVMRLLADQDIGTILPDLPGTNESLFPQQETNLDIWQEALSQCRASNPGCSFIASFRGGSLVDHELGNLPVWRLAPVKGKSLLRTLMRARIGADKEMGKSTTMANLTELAETETIELAGNLISPIMFAQLQKSDSQQSAKVRTARLESDSKPADIKLRGSPLWLRAEPDSDKELSRSVASDIADWVRI